MEAVEAVVDQGEVEVQGEAAVAVAVVVAEIDGNHKLHTPLE
jgi:tellurite resistance protein